jgi:3-dehydroquinate synthase
MSSCVTVRTGKEYNVYIGSGLIEESGARIKALLPSARVALITDSNVAPLYAQCVQNSLEAAGIDSRVFVLPAGEQNKRLSTVENILEWLAQQGFSRSDCIVALGGGVVGDMAGFAAAVYLRGISYVQMPTTLLAAVDSSVGGKTAINLNAGKNLAGAFYQPRLVICDPDTLSTLPPAILADGCAEGIKYGVINDAALFRMLQDGTSPASEQVIARCVQNKRDIVEQDEFDTGLRRLLNLGHTVAHAIETLSHFEISHGSAVAMGTLAIMRAAVAHGLCPKGDLDALTSLTQRLRLPTECPYGMADVAAAALADKKRNGDTITLIVPYAIGDSRPYTLPADELQAWLQAR